MFPKSKLRLLIGRANFPHNAGYGIFAVVDETRNSLLEIFGVFRRRRDFVRVDAHILAVHTAIEEREHILSEDTVYFSTAPYNESVDMIIGNHYFCKIF